MIDVRKMIGHGVVMVIGMMMLAMFFVSCGGGGDDDDDDNNGADYFPNADGTTWNYTVTDTQDNSTYESTTQISGTQQFAGKNCQILKETSTDSPGEKMHTFIIDTGSLIEFYGYESFENGTMTESFTNPAVFVQFEYPFIIDLSWSVVNLTGIRFSQWDPADDDDIDNDGTPDSLDIRIIARITEHGSVTVPAGTFDSYTIEYTASGTIHASSYGDITLSGLVSKIWVSVHIGVVQSEDYDFMDGILLERSKLSSYVIGS